METVIGAGMRIDTPYPKPRWINWNIDNKINLLIILWILDKIITTILFLTFGR